MDGDGSHGGDETLCFGLPFAPSSRLEARRDPGLRAGAQAAVGRGSRQQRRGPGACLRPPPCARAARPTLAVGGGDGRPGPRCPGRRRGEAPAAHGREVRRSGAPSRSRGGEDPGITSLRTACPPPPLARAARWGETSPSALCASRGGVRRGRGEDARGAWRGGTAVRTLRRWTLRSSPASHRSSGGLGRGSRRAWSRDAPLGLWDAFPPRGGEGACPLPPRRGVSRLGARGDASSGVSPPSPCATLVAFASSPGFCRWENPCRRPPVG